MADAAHALEEGPKSSGLGLDDAGTEVPTRCPSPTDGVGPAESVDQSTESSPAARPSHQHRAADDVELIEGSRGNEQLHHDFIETSRFSTAEGVDHSTGSSSAADRVEFMEGSWGNEWPQRDPIEPTPFPTAESGDLSTETSHQQRRTADADGMEFMDMSWGTEWPQHDLIGPTPLPIGSAGAARVRRRASIAFYRRQQQETGADCAAILALAKPPGLAAKTTSVRQRAPEEAQESENATSGKGAGLTDKMGLEATVHIHDDTDLLQCHKVDLHDSGIVPTQEAASEFGGEAPEVDSSSRTGDGRRHEATASEDGPSVATAEATDTQREEVEEEDEQAVVAAAQDGQRSATMVKVTTSHGGWESAVGTRHGRPAAVAATATESQSGRKAEETPSKPVEGTAEGRNNDDAMGDGQCLALTASKDGPGGGDAAIRGGRRGVETAKAANEGPDEAEEEVVGAIRDGRHSAARAKAGSERSRQLRRGSGVGSQQGRPTDASASATKRQPSEELQELASKPGGVAVAAPFVAGSASRWVRRRSARAGVKLPSLAATPTTFGASSASQAELPQCVSARGPSRPEGAPRRRPASSSLHRRVVSEDGPSSSHSSGV